LKANINQSLGADRFENRTLKLRRQTHAIRGKLLDLWQPDIPMLLKAFKESSKNGYHASLYPNNRGNGLLGRDHLQQLIPSVVTDENGAFELSGIGDDQLVTLTLAGERVQAQVINVLGRTMETARIPHIAFHAVGAKDVYTGRDFTLAVGPSVAVEGVVTDYDTGEPIAGAVISVIRLFGGDKSQERLDTRHFRAVADQKGRFRITGLPPGQKHVLRAVPPTSQPYLTAAHEVSLSLDDGDVKEIEVKVKKGIWIEGQLTDKQTGKPLSGTVDYQLGQTRIETRHLDGPQSY